MRVRDIMTREVSCIRSSEALSEAAKRMWDCDCGAIPVIDDASRVIGMITDRDICMSCWAEDRAPSAIPVTRAMSSTLHACLPGDSLARAEEIMRSNQVRRLPVVDEAGRVVGIISLADIVREAERDQKRQSTEVMPDEVASTLASICERRPIAARPFLAG